MRCPWGKKAFTGYLGADESTWAEHDATALMARASAPFPGGILIDQGLADKFLHEHTHDDFEVRFFVEGEGLFNIRKEGHVYAMRCVKGDLLSVPAHTTHWFDMGPEPSFVAIRFFTEPDGWVGHFTGTDIAQRFPRYGKS